VEGRTAGEPSMLNKLYIHAASELGGKKPNLRCVDQAVTGPATPATSKVAVPSRPEKFIVRLCRRAQEADGARIKEALRGIDVLVTTICNSLARQIDAGRVLHTETRCQDCRPPDMVVIAADRPPSDSGKPRRRVRSGSPAPVVEMGMGSLGEDCGGECLKSRVAAAESTIMRASMSRISCWTISPAASHINGPAISKGASNRYARDSKLKTPQTVTLEGMGRRCARCGRARP